MAEDWDDFGYGDEPDAEQEPRRDSKVDEAKIALEDFFEEHPSEVLYERQIEVIFEDRFFHWITGKALHELRIEDRIASDLVQLTGPVSIRFYRATSHRFWKRQAKEIADLVRSFSAPPFTRALGQHGELMFDAALPIEGFMPRGRDVGSYAGKAWTPTAHDLDRLFERDGITYGAEIKNTLSYIPLDEMRTKLLMCNFFGIKPLFIVRMAPKSYIEEVRQRGGYTLVFKHQLDPHGYSQLARTVRERLRIPADSPARIEEGTIKRFLSWHLRQLK